MKNCKMLVIILSVLLVSSCNTAAEVEALNSEECRNNGGIHSMPPLKQSNQRLVFCKDGTVRWTKSGGH